MHSILNKIFIKKKNLIEKDNSFKKIRSNTKINRIFEAVKDFSEISEIRYVGGCIRKILKNETVDDIDLATNLNPSQISACLKKNNINFLETGVKYGTITVIIDNKKFEITSLRKDISTDGRHAEVEFSDDWKLDASRRDFTINAIYADLEGNLFDPFNGKKDLEDGNINFIGDSEIRIKEDYLRILRYIRFFLNYSKKEHLIEVKKSIKKNIDGVKNLSSERLLQELKKIFLSKNFIKINNDKFCVEILLLIFPQLKNIHLFDKLSIEAKKIFSSKDFIFLLSLMIVDDSDNSDYFLYKFNLSNEEKKRIEFFKKMFVEVYEKKFFLEKNMWQIFYLYDKEYLIDLIDFKIFRSSKNVKKLIQLKNFFTKQIKPVFPVKGSQLINDYNLKEGKELGRILKKIENVWIKNNFQISDKEIHEIMKN